MFNSAGFKFHTHTSLFFIIVLIVPFVISSCSEPSGPGLIPTPYVSLNVGDERQIMSLTDSSTILLVVTDTLRREDGKLVYQVNQYYGTGTTPVIQYALIENGFYKYTHLDTIVGTSHFTNDNIFGEQILAIIYPNEGDTWSRKIIADGDTLTHWFSAHLKEYLIVPAGKFHDCFGFVDDFGQSVFYARGIGYIGTSINDTLKFAASYLKINEKVFGSKVPPRNSPDWW